MGDRGRRSDMDDPTASSGGPRHGMVLASTTDNQTAAVGAGSSADDTGDNRSEGTVHGDALHDLHDGSSHSSCSSSSTEPLEDEVQERLGKKGDQLVALYYALFAKFWQQQSMGPQEPYPTATTQTLDECLDERNIVVFEKRKQRVFRQMIQAMDPMHQNAEWYWPFWWLVLQIARECRNTLDIASVMRLLPGVEDYDPDDEDNDTEPMQNVRQTVAAEIFTAMLALGYAMDHCMMYKRRNTAREILLQLNNHQLWMVTNHGPMKHLTKYQYYVAALIQCGADNGEHPNPDDCMILYRQVTEQTTEAFNIVEGLDFLHSHEIRQIKEDFRFLVYLRYMMKHIADVWKGFNGNPSGDQWKQLMAPILADLCGYVWACYYDYCYEACFEIKATDDDDADARRLTEVEVAKSLLSEVVEIFGRLLVELFLQNANDSFCLLAKYNCLEVTTSAQYSDLLAKVKTMNLDLNAHRKVVGLVNVALEEYTTELERSIDSLKRTLLELHGELRRVQHHQEALKLQSDALKHDNTLVCKRLRGESARLSIERKHTRREKSTNATLSLQLAFYRLRSNWRNNVLQMLLRALNQRAVGRVPKSGHTAVSPGTLQCIVHVLMRMSGSAVCTYRTGKRFFDRWFHEAEARKAAKAQEHSKTLEELNETLTKELKEQKALHDAVLEEQKAKNEQHAKALEKQDEEQKAKNEQHARALEKQDEEQKAKNEQHARALQKQDEEQKAKNEQHARALQKRDEDLQKRDEELKELQVVHEAEQTRQKEANDIVSSAHEAKTECVLCWETIAQNDRAATIPCGHANFCTTCAAKLVDKACPTCGEHVDLSVKLFCL